MKIQIVHTEPGQQPVAATLAKEIYRSLPRTEARIASVSQARADDDSLILAVFSVRNGAFAPIVPFYRELRDQKVAFVAVLTGPVDPARVRKTVWGIKKQFCGNQVLAGYLCPADDDVAWGLSADELGKVLAFARRTYEEHCQVLPAPMAVNY
ncbi:MAG: hypothetical protein LBP33_11500 [Candidatus Adiutrix sp.]|jgi:hypothetical protein|nr:hypothetical protein [Candidatus Adiutrix sp.]